MLKPRIICSYPSRDCSNDHCCSKIIYDNQYQCCCSTINGAYKSFSAQKQIYIWNRKYPSHFIVYLIICITMNDNILLRLWHMTYYISSILIPIMIIFSFIFNHFDTFNMIFAVLACLFQFTMFLSLRLRNRKTIFMYSAICLTVVHCCTFIYFLYVTRTLTAHIRYDLEKDIFSNHTKLKYKMQIRICKSSIDNEFNKKEKVCF